ncbi:MAG: hypothetical protein M1816_001371 [Peltula sp. TS41687]|nr:MAG: hypothetical protein M1816_001371 [Peltula sp. TS41687]
MATTQVQTRFSSPAGQDPDNMPYSYNSDARLQTQILARHARGPASAGDIGAALIRRLGMSDVSLSVLQALYDRATVQPAMVQNRFHAAEKYDVQLRRFCREKGITYRLFWTLTVNPELRMSQHVVELADLAGVSSAVGLYGLVMSLGVTVLKETTSLRYAGGFGRD